MIYLIDLEKTNDQLFFKTNAELLCFKELQHVLDKYEEAQKSFNDAVEYGVTYIEDMDEQSNLMINRNHCWSKLIGFIEGMYMSLGIEASDNIILTRSVASRINKLTELHLIIDGIREQIRYISSYKHNFEKLFPEVNKDNYKQYKKNSIKTKVRPKPFTKSSKEKR